MSKKLTIEFVREQFEKEGYTLLSKKYISNNQILKYVCPKGHIETVCFGNWQQGHRCPTCYGNKKYTIDFIRKQFEKEGYTLVSTEYINNKQKLEYICSKGHKGCIRWDSWKQNKRCNECGYENNRKKYRGNKHSRWNPSLTDEERKIKRDYLEYVEWSYGVKERDKFTCQICDDDKGGNLVSHHLESYNNNHELRIDLNNGICLCEKCHKDFHSKYGYGNNTKNQFKEFKKK